MDLGCKFKLTICKFADLHYNSTDMNNNFDVTADEFARMASAGAIKKVVLEWDGALSVYVAFYTLANDKGYVQTVRKERRRYRFDTCLLFLSNCGLTATELLLKVDQK